MSGHSKWSQIKHKKGVTDKKRGQLFSKLSKVITITAKIEPNPQFNPCLRSAIEKAKENQVPQENIERAIRRASESTENLEELTMEAYGPEGSAILIEAITDSRNRTVSEVKKILKDCDAKWAEPGSVLWAFSSSAELRGTDAEERGSENDRNTFGAGESKWQAKFPQEISEEGKEKLGKLLEALEEHEDVEDVVTNVIFNF